MLGVILRYTVFRLPAAHVEGRISDAVTSGGISDIDIGIDRYDTEKPRKAYRYDFDV